MKLMFETETEHTPFVGQELNESTGEKRYVIRGIFSSPGQKNKNGRVYPMNVWENELKRYNEDVLAKGHPDSLMELEHPPRNNVDMMEAVAKINKLWIENGYVMGEAFLLNNEKANQLKSLIDCGIKMSVSSRGVGSVNESGVVTTYKLICFDIIANLAQSDHNAVMNGIVEGVLLKEDFDIDEKGDIVKICSKDKCLTENRQVVNDAIISKFKEFFNINEEASAEGTDAEVTKDSKTPMKLPTSFSNVTVGDFITVMKMINHNDKIARYMEITQMIEQIEDLEKYITFQTIRRVNQAVRSKRYIQSVDELK